MITTREENQTVAFLNDGICFMKEQQEEAGVLISLFGDLTSKVEHEIHDELSALIWNDVQIMLDFSNVSYIAASMVSVCLEIQKKIDVCGKGGLALRHLPDAIYDEFENMGVLELLHVLE